MTKTTLWAAHPTATAATGRADRASAPPAADLAAWTELDEDASVPIVIADGIAAGAKFAAVVLVKVVQTGEATRERGTLSIEITYIIINI